MTTYTITAGTISMDYEAASREEAIALYVALAGYDSIADAADACGQSQERFLADITVTEAQ